MNGAMSAIGPKQTCASALHMSAFGGKGDVKHTSRDFGIGAFGALEYSLVIEVIGWLARSLEEAVTGAEVAAFHSNGVVRRNRVNLLCLSWKSRPSSDCKNDCDCDAAQDTHGRSPLSCSGELALID